MLRAVSAFNDRVQELLFRPNHLAPTFSEDQVVKPPRFNAYYDIEDVKPVDGASWKLELAGLIDNKTPWTAEQIYALPEQEMIIRHICVEGWDYIGQWSGREPAAFPRTHRRRHQGEIRRVQMRRRLYREHRHGDGAASADDPGDEICQGADHRSVRLSAAAARPPTKLGFKNAKWITAMEVTNTYPEQLLVEAGLQLVRRDMRSASFDGRISARARTSCRCASRRPASTRR